VLLYPVYAVLFAETGLSAAEISSLFAIWSVTGFVLEVPSGLWADVYSRRRLLTLAPLLSAAGFALWTFLPCYPSFAAGFVLWGAGSALRSGTLQALVYEELSRAQARDSYARLIGRARAVGTTAVLAADALAGPVLAAGGYRTLGIASVAATLLGVPVAMALPESRGQGEETPDEGLVAVLREGFAEVRGSPGARRCLVLVAALSGFDAMDEYVPLLARSTGVGPAVAPVLVLLVTAGVTVGGFLAGRGQGRAAAPALAVAACCLAVGAMSGRPAGMVLVAVAFGVFQWATVAADARLQERIADGSRATVTSMAGFGTEVVAVMIFAGYAAGSRWTGPGPLFALAAVPYVVVAAALGRSRR
jgi:predicted MFS family arabinose efflux permease